MELRPYQETGRDFLAAHTRALLADEMRVGKTPQAILAAHKIGAKRLLVVCPAIGVAHWQRELQMWWPDSKSPDTTIYSYDKARRYMAEGLKYPQRWDLMIVDECHFAKNPEAGRTKAVYGKGGFGWNADRIWVLSGTPAPKHAGELWPMMYAFGLTSLSYDTFCRLYCRLDRDNNPKGTKVSMIPEIRQALSRVSLRRTRREVAPEIPDIDYQFLAVAPTGVDLPPYVQWNEHNPGAFAVERHKVAHAKVDSLVDQIVFAIENELIKQTVVFGWHIDPIHAVVAKLRQHGIVAEPLTGGTSPVDRAHVQQKFKYGMVQVVCANLLAAGTTIDLSAARHAYFLELDWVPGNNVQAANRLVSMEKVDPVTCDVVTWPGSFDDRVQASLLTRTRELSKLFR